MLFQPDNTRDYAMLDRLYMMPRKKPATGECSKVKHLLGLC